MSKPKVSVCMIVYNHEKYIEEAIRGVLIQQTNFDIEFILANDASKDKTHEIICKLAIDTEKISFKYFNHKENLGMIPNFVFALKECTGKYIALCEGDDYWTDPLKLQKQVDYLDKNKDFIAHSHNTHFVDERYEIQSNRVFSSLSSRQISIYDLCPVRTFHTASLIFRNEALKNVDFPYMLNYIMSGDKYIYMLLFLKGKIFYDEKPMAFYRRNDGGVSASMKLHLFMDSDIKMYSKFLSIVPNEYKKALYESINYYKLNRFKFLANHRMSFRLVYYYLLLIPIIGKTKYLGKSTFIQLSKQLLKNFQDSFIKIKPFK